MRTRTRAGLGFIVGLAFLSGCGIDVELTSTPETVALGGQVSHTIKVTNATVCPMDSGALIFYPHLSPEEEASLDEGVFDPGVIAALCDIEASGLPDGFAESAIDASGFDAAWDRHREAASPAQSANANLAGATLNCTPMTDGFGIDFFDCAIDPLAAGAMATLELQVAADQLGTLRNFALANSFLDTSLEVCDGGARAGQACDEDADCPGGASCDPGICQGGMGNGVGCEDDADCGDGGDCVDCDTCQIAGVCSGGPEAGSACFNSEECDQGEGFPVACQCGIPVDCTATNVVAAMGTAPAMSTGGWVAAIVALFAIGAFALRRRFSRGMNAANRLA